MYIETGPEQALAYLTDLANLEHWTLGTRVTEQLDRTTWVGHVTSARDPIYFHVEETPGFPVPTFEWQVGRAAGNYAMVHRLFAIPASFAHPGRPAGGVYFHWLSFSHPARRTVLAELGYDRIVHATESRHLKAVLERAHGWRAPAPASHRLCSASVYVDAASETLAAYLGDLANAPQWARMWRGADANPATGTTSAAFLDAYLQPFHASTSISRDRAMILVDLHLAPETGGARPSRILAAILPCAHVFGDPEAGGCVLHRIAFAPEPCAPVAEHPSGDAYGAHGPHDPRDLLAESLSIKRHVELLAGRPGSFAQGFSYPSPARPRDPSSPD